jgi:hypothetical protein
MPTFTIIMTTMFTIVYVYSLLTSQPQQKFPAARLRPKWVESFMVAAYLTGGAASTLTILIILMAIVRAIT